MLKKLATLLLAAVLAGSVAFAMDITAYAEAPTYEYCAEEGGNYEFEPFRRPRLRIETPQ